MKHALNLVAKRIAIAVLIGSASTVVASANDGTITFEGTISDATCEISGGDDASPNQGPDFTVRLPNVSTTALAKVGELAGDTPFYINLSGSQCPNGKVANVIFERAQSTNIDTTTGNLKNHTIDGAATNVQVRILNVDKKNLNLNQANNNHQPIKIAENKAQFKYWGQYIAVGGATKAGTVKTDVVYSVTYN